MCQSLLHETDDAETEVEGAKQTTILSEGIGGAAGERATIDTIVATAEVQAGTSTDQLNFEQRKAVWPLPCLPPCSLALLLGKAYLPFSACFFAVSTWYDPVPCGTIFSLCCVAHPSLQLWSTLLQLHITLLTCTHFLYHATVAATALPSALPVSASLSSVIRLPPCSCLACLLPNGEGLAPLLPNGEGLARLLPNEEGLACLPPYRSV